MNKIDAGRLLVGPLLAGEDALEKALAELTALDLALVAAQRTFALQPAAFEALVAETGKARAALIAARRSQRRVHVGILRIRADEGMEEDPFGCDRSCFPATGARAQADDGTPILTAGRADDRVAPWHSSSAFSSSWWASAATPSGGAERRSGSPA